MADRQLLLPQLPRPTRPLGRNINHDPQSLRFLVAPKTATVTPRTVFWPRRTPLLNQGLPEPGVGSCTLSSSLGVLGSDPFWNTLPDEIRQRLSDGRDAQRLAVELYSRTTENDPFPGTYPPEDTGSDGNSAAKTLRDAGLISGWEHITSLAAAEIAIQRGPFITGTVWLSGMDSPDRTGVIAPTGTAEGGHEYHCFGRQIEYDLWWFWQTWGENFGVEPPVPEIAAAVPGLGAFAMTSKSLAWLLGQQGDATQFVPLSEPAPTPAPTPAEEAEFPLELVEPWIDGRHYTVRERKAAEAIESWVSSRAAAQ
jgi:hypothetical protein